MNVIPIYITIAIFFVGNLYILKLSPRIHDHATDRKEAREKLQQEIKTTMENPKTNPFLKNIDRLHVYTMFNHISLLQDSDSYAGLLADHVLVVPLELFDGQRMIQDIKDERIDSMYFGKTVLKIIEAKDFGKYMIIGLQLKHNDTKMRSFDRQQLRASEYLRKNNVITMVGFKGNERNNDVVEEEDH